MSVAQQLYFSIIRSESPHQTSSVPRGACCKFIFLHKNSVGHTKFSQVVLGLTSKTATPYNNHISLLWQC